MESDRMQQEQSATNVPAAQVSLSMPWDGILLRCTPGDDGSVPRAMVGDSPDIVILDQPLPDPGVLAQPGNYDGDNSSGLTIGVPNYIYLRGMNPTESIQSGIWHLYWAPRNLLLYPGLWVNNPLFTASGNPGPEFQIEPGAIGVSADCFVWTPPPTTGDGYSLIAIATTPEEPVTQWSFTGIDDLASMLLNQGNIAQRNLQVLPGATQTMTDSIAYAQGSLPGTVYFRMQFENMPGGSSWGLSSGAAPPDSPTLFCPEGTDTSLPWSLVVNLPAEWSMIISYSVTLGTDWSGVPAGAQPQATLTAEWYPMAEVSALAGSDAGPSALVPVGSASSVLGPAG
jgi:hypothetical protein